MLTLDDAFGWLRWIRRYRPGARDGRVRVTPALGYELAVLGSQTWPTGYVPMATDSRPFGLAVDVDEWLPPGVWRLCDDDGTLLRDCREGKTLRELLS